MPHSLRNRKDTPHRKVKKDEKTPEKSGIKMMLYWYISDIFLVL